MNLKEIELIKERVRKEIKVTYSPIPHYIDIWEEENGESFMAIVKHGKGENEDTIISSWGYWQGNINCESEIMLTEETCEHLYKLKNEVEN